MKYTDRFKDAPWIEKCQKEKILIGGIGGIGSNALYFLSKSIPAIYYLFDDDIVDMYNIGTQFFTKNSVGKLKIDGIVKTLDTFGHDSIFYTFNNKILSNSLPISIAAFDNMSARKELFYNWKSREDKELFIDGRLSATIYQIYTVTPDRIDAYEKTLFEDSAIEDAPCTFKQTVHFAGIIGARITQILTNYLSNKYANENIMNVPYMIEESGEPFYIKINYETV